MTTPSDYLQELQQAETAQGVVQLRTLALEFDATLARLPRLRQEVNGWIDSAGSGIDHNALAARMEVFLTAASDWLLDYDLLPAPVRETPELIAFMKLAGDTMTGRTVAGTVQKFQAAKLEAEKASAKNDPLAKYGYVDNGNGTITDTNTGLMWKQRREGGTFTWDDAVKRFNGKDGAIQCGGFSDWRLPTIDELKTLIQTGRSQQICEEVFPDSSALFWSSSKGDEMYVWTVDFRNGHVGDRSRGHGFLVRLVRANP